MIKLSQPQIPESAIERVSEILKSGQLVHGEECNTFEKELANFLGCKHALVVSSGTAALHIALLALGVGKGDAVLVPNFTFAATANIVEITGAKAIIVDVEPDSYNMDCSKLIATIKSWNYPERLKAIMPVLEFGNPTHLKKYKNIADQYNLHLIEDAACALGAKDNNMMAGTVGDFGCFSFHPRKTLTTGEGGAVVTNNDSLYERAMLLRNHGMIRTADGLIFKSIGLNYRLTDFQAAIGRRMLPILNEWIEKRKKLAHHYLSLLKPLEEKQLISLPKMVEGHSMQTFMIVLSDEVERPDVMKYLYDHGIESAVGAQGISELGNFNHLSNGRNSLIIGKNLHFKGLALPLHEGLFKKDIRYVSLCLKKILEL